MHLCAREWTCTHRHRHRQRETHTGKRWKDKGKGVLVFVDVEFLLCNGQGKRERREGRVRGYLRKGRLLFGRGTDGKVKGERQMWMWWEQERKGVAAARTGWNRDRIGQDNKERIQKWVCWRVRKWVNWSEQRRKKRNKRKKGRRQEEVDGEKAQSSSNDQLTLGHISSSRSGMASKKQEMGR